MIILDSQDVHDVEKMVIEVGLSKFNTLKIVPLNEFAQITQVWKGMKK